MKNRDKLVEIIQKYAAKPYKNPLLEEILPSIRLKTKGVPCKELGKTKLGGCPDFSRIKLAPINAYGENLIEESYDKEETEMTSNHHLLGHYQGIQNEYLELSFIDAKRTDHQNLTLEQIEEALRWKLLFQFDSDDSLQFSWGDWGRIYFFIHENDLRKHNFSNIKILADCY